MKVSQWWGRLGWCCLLALVFLSSCRRERPSNFDSNLPPETYVTSAPAESTTSYYQTRLFWYGVDPDGFVDHYEYSVTDTNKTPGEDDIGFTGYFSTEKTDSLFILTANRPQILGHRFYVRAIDNEGKMDPSPAWTYFVASDFNFPNVVWRYARATWTDRSGQTRTKSVRSNRELIATDTVGVGSVVTAGWEGFDADPGGFVTGYEYRSNADPQFLGGSLADTTITLSYARPVGSDLSSYFSGKDIIRVRAIDDAGAKTTPDSLRSFIVNFNPIAWIVDPDQLSPPVRGRFFIDNASGNKYPSGAILADRFRSVRFKFTGFDDPRDQSLDESNPSGIIGFSYRKLKDGGGRAYQNIADWAAFPDVADFDNASVVSQLDSGRYLFLIRATDELERNGQPDSLAFSVNYPPFFSSVRYVDAEVDSIDYPLWIPGPTPGSQADTVTVTLTQNPGGGYDDLVIRYQGLDDHFVAPDTHPLDVSFVWPDEEELSQVTDYLSRLNNSRDGFVRAPDTGPGEKSFPVSPSGGTGVVRPGLNRLELQVRDISKKTTSLTVIFNVVLE